MTEPLKPWQKGRHIDTLPVEDNPSLSRNLPVPCDEVRDVPRAARVGPPAVPGDHRRSPWACCGDDLGSLR